MDCSGLGMSLVFSWLVDALTHMHFVCLLS